MTDLDAKHFDQAWAAAMVKDHHPKAIALFTAEIRQTQDPEVHAFAERTLPTRKTHLELARQLLDQLDMPSARDEAMNRSVSMAGSFARTHPADATTARIPATPAWLPANAGGSH